MASATEYIVSPAQVRRLRSWLEDWMECPWCERDLYGIKGKWGAKNHTPRCLFALIAGER